MELPRLNRRRPSDATTARTEPPFDPTSWSGALITMSAVLAVLWVIEIVDRSGHHHWDTRFGLKPRELDGLWGVVTQPFLHDDYSHLLSNTFPLLGVGWALLLSGVRVFAFVAAFVTVVGGLATWLVAPSGVIVGASGLVFGLLGYLLARAYFSRRLKWIITALALLIFFGTFLGQLLPSLNARISWQSHLCGFLAGILVGWLLHPRTPTRASRAVRRPAP